jgi:O-succinylbenzoic acid--CoA ligase
MITIEEIFAEKTKRFGSNCAIITADEELTYDDFWKKIKIVYNHLENIKTNRPIGIFIEDSAKLLISIFAVGLRRYPFFRISEKLTKEQIKYYLNKTKITTVISANELIMKIENINSNLNIISINDILDKNRTLSEIKKRGGNDFLFCIFLSSGTTGEPKLITHHFSDFIFTGNNCAKSWGINSNDRTLSMIPLTSACAFASLVMPTLLKGAALIIAPSRNPETLSAFIKEKNVSFVLGTPTNFIQILREQKASKCFSQIKMQNKIRGTIAGAPIPDWLIPEVKAKLNIRLFPHYGLSELLAVTRVEKDGNAKTAGKPWPKIKIKIMNALGKKTKVNESGEIFCKTSSGPAGYFATGDLGLIDKNSDLQIIGRVKETIFRGGNNIYPAEIENVLLKHTAVSACKITSKSDAVYGEKIVALIKLKKPITKKNFCIFLKDYLPSFKIPDQIFFVKNIMTTESGKVKCLNA